MTATNIAFLRARPGREPWLGQALHALVALSRGNPDCQLANLHRSEEDPALWLLYENWTTQEALWRHLGSPGVQSFVSQSAGLLESDVGLRGFQLLPREPIELAA